jgi:hypothetical protein
MSGGLVRRLSGGLVRHLLGGVNEAIESPATVTGSEKEKKQSD